MSSVNMPTARKEKTSPLDTIAKALGIATSVLSIKNGLDENSRAETTQQAALKSNQAAGARADTELADKLKNSESNRAVEAATIEQKGKEKTNDYRVSPKDLLGMSDKGTISYLKVPGSQPVPTYDEQGQPTTAYFKPAPASKLGGGITPEEDIKFKIQFSGSQPVQHMDAINTAANAVNEYYKAVGTTEGRRLLTNDQRSDLKSKWSKATTSLNKVAGLGALAGADLNIIKGGLPVTWGIEGASTQAFGNAKSALKANLTALQNGFDQTKNDIDQTFSHPLFEGQKLSKFSSFPKIKFDEDKIKVPGSDPLMQTAQAQDDPFTAQTARENGISYQQAAHLLKKSGYGR